MNKTAVSGNNAFFASIGLIEGGNNKHLTDKGLRAALTLDHPGTPEAFDAWRNVIEGSTDLERIVDAIRIRKGMDEDALLSHIVLTAGVPKTARWITGARTIVDILEFAGVVEESEGRIRARTLPELEDSGTVTMRLTPSGGEFVTEPSAKETSTVTAEPSVRSGTARLVVNVHIWVSAADVDFEHLSTDLKKLLTTLTE